MRYNLDDIINRYKRNCDKIYREKTAHLDIYESGIITKVQDDHKNKKINKNDLNYFENLEMKLKSIEKQISDDIYNEILIETKNFSTALTSYLLLDYDDDYKVELNKNLITEIKNIYNTDNTIKQETIKLNASNQSLEEILKEIRELLK